MSSVCTGGQADAQRRDAIQMVALHHGIGEMRGADHHRFDPPQGRTAGGRGDQINQRLAHAVRDIDGGRPLQRGEHLAALEQNGIAIGAADVDSDAAHAGSSPKTLRNSTSGPKARGPTWRSPSTLRWIGCDGRAMTVTLWP